jgi:hypothetical protein
MRINPRSFWTQNERGPTQVGIIVLYRKTRTPRDARVVLECLDTGRPFGIVGCLCEVRIDVNVARNIGSLKGL